MLDSVFAKTLNFCLSVTSSARKMVKLNMVGRDVNFLRALHVSVIV